MRLSLLLLWSQLCHTDYVTFKLFSFATIGSAKST